MNDDVAIFTIETKITSRIYARGNATTSAADVAKRQISDLMSMAFVDCHPRAATVGEPTVAKVDEVHYLGEIDVWRKQFIEFAQEDGFAGQIPGDDVLRLYKDLTPHAAWTELKTYCQKQRL